ncbi:MAG: Ig-like domain-containing protein [Candidatus Natronoplasma sp.]
MKWKKILSFAIVSVLVMSGLAVMSGHTRAQDDEGTLIDEVNFDVVLDQEDGVAATLDGETHMFMQGVDGLVYNSLDEDWRVELETWDVQGSYNNLLLNPAHEGKNTTAINEAIDEGWIDEPEDIQWLANNADGEWTVNPFAHNDIRFALQYLNRQSMIEDLQDGFGFPRYGFMATAVEAWGQYFDEGINQEFDVGPEGDEDYMSDWIQASMEEIQEEVAFGEVTGNADDGWYYNPEDGDEHQIEIIIMARSEDWRQDLGEYIGDVLEDEGFDVVTDPTPSGEAIPRAFDGSPEPYDNLDYHIYTGGWVSTTAVAYQHDACSQMYAPWYGFMQTGGSEDHWQYDDEGYDKPIAAHEDGKGWDSGATVGDMDMEAQNLYLGLGMEKESEYWNQTIDVTQLGFTESLRVFLTTSQSFYPYNPEKMQAAVPEAINGYDTYFGPRTMRTDDGTLETEILTGEDQPYMDNWNLFGGSADVYGEYQRRLVREYGAWQHPGEGLPMQVNNYWMDNEELEEHRPERNHPYDIQGGVETNFTFDEDGELIENITIPDDAVDYFPENRTWKTVDEYIEEENRSAAVKVTVDVHEEHVWHDGTDFSIQDLMAAYARNKELGDETHEPYLKSWDNLNSVFWNSIHATTWDVENGTYTMWGDYTFPVEDLVGYHYSLSAEVHPLTYEGWNHLHGGDETEYGGIADETFDYEPGDDNWIHQISSSQNEVLVDVLEAMNDDDWVPYYLRDSENSPIPMDEDELTTQLDSVIDFINTHEHSYIGTGPFMLDTYDENDHTLHLERWDDYGFPFEGEEAEGETFEYGYWSEQFEIAGARMDYVEAPEEATIGEEIEASGTGAWEELFPEPGEVELTEDELNDYRYTLRDELNGEILVEVTSDDIELTPEGSYSSFNATIPTEELEEGGAYTLQLEGQEIEDGPWDIASQRITFFESVWDVEITSPADGDGFEAGDEVTVEYTITAEYDDTQDIVFSVGDEEVDTEEIELEDGEEHDGEFTWEADDDGDHDLTVATEDEEDTVSISVGEEEDEDDDGIPGFTMLLMVLAAVVAVAIYYNKEQ